MISRSKLAGIAVSALLGVSVASAQTAPFVRTAIVAPTPGNPTASGTTLLTTLAGLSPAPSSTNKWLVKIEPGIFDVGTTALQMTDYVDIEGSGILVTTIRGNVGPTTVAADDVVTLAAVTTLNNGLVRGANNAEIRELTIECVPSVQQPACMGMINDAVSPRVSNLRIMVNASSAGSHWGMRNYNSSPVLDTVEMRVSNSTNGDNYGMVNVQSSPGASMPVLRNSQITATGTGFNNWGILNRGTAKVNPILHSTVNAIGGSHAAGLVHNAVSSGTGVYYVENSIIFASGGSVDSIGIDSSDTTDTSLKQIVRTSRIAGDTIGIKNYSGATVIVSNSQLYGATNAVNGGTVRVGGTWFQGGTVSAVSGVCASNWDNSFTQYASTCP
jgi:hypothetical protein